MTKRILVTGAEGFIGKNLIVRMREMGMEAVPFVRRDPSESLLALVSSSDAVIHLAGENRPLDPSGFESGNVELTRRLSDAIKTNGRRIPIVFASSAQAEQDNLYGRSKLAAEHLIANCITETGGSAVVYRLPGVFGKWCKPNYNSVVATFCYNTARGLPINVRDSSAALRLVYVDDVVNELLHAVQQSGNGISFGHVNPEHTITLGELASYIQAFRDSRVSLMTDRVGSGIIRALYSTYVSYLPPEQFVYNLPKYGDERGVFVEMLKTPDCGQFSYFTAHPGVTRGGHYHHTKTEKFLVIRGKARFGFRHIVSGDAFALCVSGDQPQVVETVPGWTHDITNVGTEDMVVMLWANEVFDREKPDTVACEV